MPLGHQPIPGSVSVSYMHFYAYNNKNEVQCQQEFYKYFEVNRRITNRRNAIRPRRISLISLRLKNGENDPIRVINDG